MGSWTLSTYILSVTRWSYTRKFVPEKLWYESECCQQRNGKGWPLIVDVESDPYELSQSAASKLGYTCNHYKNKCKWSLDQCLVSIIC